MNSDILSLVIILLFGSYNNSQKNSQTSFSYNELLKPELHKTNKDEILKSKPQSVKIENFLKIVEGISSLHLKTIVQWSRLLKYVKLIVERESLHLKTIVQWLRKHPNYRDSETAKNETTKIETFSSFGPDLNSTLISGSFSYSTNDGTRVIVTFVADKNGFTPSVEIKNTSRTKNETVQEAKNDLKESRYYPDVDTLSISGSYSYPTQNDKFVFVTFVVDKNGFKPDVAVFDQRHPNNRDSERTVTENPENEMSYFFGPDLNSTIISGSFLYNTNDGTRVVVIFVADKNEFTPSVEVKNTRKNETVQGALHHVKDSRYYLDVDTLSISGSYSYSASNDKFIFVTFVVDKNGFNPDVTVFDHDMFHGPRAPKPPIKFSQGK